MKSTQKRALVHICAIVMALGFVVGAVSYGSTANANTSGDTSCGYHIQPGCHYVNANPNIKCGAQLVCDCLDTPNCSFPNKTANSCGPQICTYSACLPTPGCSYPQPSDMDCGIKVCNGATTEPVPPSGTAISCSYPALTPGCEIVGRTMTSCGKVECEPIHTDPPLPVAGIGLECSYPAFDSSCKIVGRTTTSCGQIVCGATATDPIVKKPAPKKPVVKVVATTTTSSATSTLVQQDAEAKAMNRSRLASFLAHLRNFFHF